MPKAKRTKLVSLNKTSKHQKDVKERLMQKLESNTKKYTKLVFLEISNLTNEVQTQLRADIKGELVFGKKSVLAKFFENMGEKDENYLKASEFLKNVDSQVTVLFTNESIEDIQKQIVNTDVTVFAQPGTKALATVELQPGNEVFDHISTSNANYLRNLGVFVTVQKGKLNLEEKVLAAQKNEALTVNQSKLLKVLGVKLGRAEVRLLCAYDHKQKMLSFF